LTGGRRQDQIAVVAADPARATVYAEGWQSWSVVTPLPATAAPHVVTAPESLVIDCQYGEAAPAGVHQGAGLLAIDPGDGSPAEVFAAASAGHPVPVIQARVSGDSLVVSADAPVTRSTDGGHGGLASALGRWAGSYAARSGVPAGRLRPLPPVWCSWYQYHSDVTEQDVLANLAAMDELALDVGVVQIDDGYQAAPGDWLASSGRFADLPGLVRRITATGRRAGIWLAPMLVGAGSTLLARRPGWMVRDGDGEPVYAGNVCRQRCTALDLTHPHAARYLASVLTAMREWGISYFKIDFCYAGAGEGRRHEDVTGVAAYRHGLGLIRDAIGPDAFLLGCGAPILPSVGLVDAMRVGPDIAASYEPPEPNPSLPSQRNAARNTAARAWQHGRFWVNDPDCLLARPGVERREDWAETVARFGGLRSSGDGLRELDEWGLAATRRLLIPSGTAPVTGQLTAAAAPDGR
jgi:alpha-galactosidase